jgi:hypothetical protein
MFYNAGKYIIPIPQHVFTNHVEICKVNWVQTVPAAVGEVRVATCKRSRVRDRGETKSILAREGQRLRPYSPYIQMHRCF